MRPDPLDLSGRTVIVTGGTRGLGRAMAVRFCEAGADVVVCARRPPDEPVAAGGRTARFVAADVREPDQVARVVDEAVAATGRLDVLVNNAGGAPPVATADASPRFNEKIIALNLLAPLTFAQAARPHLAATGDGVIINIGSVSGERPNPLGAAYGAAKAGLVNLTATLAHEWGPEIRVLCAVVGLVDTEEARLFYGESGSEAVAATLGLGRLGTPEEIADAVFVLATPLTRWMSGAAVPVHGGGEMPAYLVAARHAADDER
ncbi:MAG: SDR family oxidoreductase [Actinomyces sp.]|nr:MAG: SDR family oxidoreductase [Actinomyces sp.]